MLNIYENFFPRCFCMKICNCQNRQIGDFRNEHQIFTVKLKYWNNRNPKSKSKLCATWIIIARVSSFLFFLIKSYFLVWNSFISFISGIIAGRWCFARIQTAKSTRSSMDHFTLFAVQSGLGLDHINSSYVHCDFYTVRSCFSTGRTWIQSEENK